MESLHKCFSQATPSSPLHMLKPWRRTALNRMFAAVYLCALLALLFRHAQVLLYSANLVSFSISLFVLFSDVVLAFMWTATQSFRMRPITRKEFPENIKKVLKTSDFPALDVFICTADPQTEPPMSVVNSALSAMAFDYPLEKVSVFVSDDGGSAPTLFALMEAAKFASHWLPFCRKNDILERSPEAYFALNHPQYQGAENIKMMYESMKVRVEHVVERGEVGNEYITGKEEREAFSKWTDGFTRHDHPAVIQVILENNKDKDITGQVMPNLIYVSREKSRTSPHHFKAGALNVLLRVSAIMSNAPIILTLDCDTHSNDPKTPCRALCYLSDLSIQSRLGYIQFPQHFRGLNKNDIYGSEFKRVFQVEVMGFDGLGAATNFGTGCFFCRQVFFNGPSDPVSSKIPDLKQCYVVNQAIQSQPMLAQAHHVAGCNYENHTRWGSEIGYRYGSVTEDYNTSYQWHCEGWKSIFCNPDRPAFLGVAPITLVDVLNQNKRWGIGHLEVGLSGCSPLTYGFKALGPLLGLGYTQYALWSVWSIPITVYAFLPQLTLLNEVLIFPKVSDCWFLLYVFLLLGAYGQDFLDFILTGGTVQRWWSDQRMWMIRGLSCYLFGLTENVFKSAGISAVGFNLTSKVLEDEQGERYEQGIFEFGVPSPMFVPLTAAAIINLLAFTKGLVEVFRGRNVEGIFLQMFIAGFGTLNAWPIYEAIILRSDKGKMPIKTTLFAAFLASALCIGAFLILK